MANRRQSIKKIRVDRRRRLVNLRVKSELRTVERKVNTLLTQKNYEAAAQAMPQYYSKLDKAVKKGVLHDNNASRSKSRFTKRLNALKSAA